MPTKSTKITKKNEKVNDFTLLDQQKIEKHKIKLNLKISYTFTYV